MYTRTNYPSKKAFKEDFKAGKKIYTYQPGGMFPAKTDGRVSLEGPHFPKPHKWYASVLLEDGVVVKILS